ncbi:helix-turn-helix domain-containing protein, partial [bacterium]|nr:helix-turn-helix domain-containing protein [candidate division CSSED10-310 bacterium]
IQEISEFCKIFSQSQPYPIHFFYNDSLFLEIPVFPIDIITAHYEAVFRISSTIFIYETPENLVFGGVHTDDNSCLLLLGPVPITTLTNELIQSIMKTYSIPSSKQEILKTYLGKGSGFSLPHLKNVLVLVNFYLNHEIEKASNAIFLSSNDLNVEIKKKYLESSIEEQDSISYRAAYEFEKEMLTIVKNGDLKSIQNRVSTSPNMHIGTLSKSSIRQMKNIFICVTTLVTRAAIEGGLDLETAYQLSDFYLQKSEDTFSAEAINELTDTMLQDFTVRTQKSKFSDDVPPDIFDCLQYIRQNTHSPLRVQTIAAYAHLSRSQLNRKFMKSLGFNPSDFIVRCKLEEAKELLTFTSKPTSEISQILCFSSQSYFCNVFKKYYQMTPLEFRQKKRQ